MTEKCFDEFPRYLFRVRNLYVMTCTHRIDAGYTDVVLGHVIRSHIGSNSDQKLEIVST